MSIAAEAIRTLAALLRAGLDVRSALVEWPAAAPEGARPALVHVARRVRLGDDAGSAVAVLGGDGSALGALLTAFTETGGDTAGALDAYAAVLDRSERARAKAAAAGSGARLSGRLVAALPLVFVPLVPKGDFDPTAIAMVVAGALLSLTGMWWIDRICPRPDRLRDPVADAAALISGLAAGGAALGDALTIAAQNPDHRLRAAARLVHLGAPWPDALARDPELAPLAAPIGRALELGVPASSALAAHAAERRAATDHAFDAAVGRATILMTIPLAVCVLPAYLLLGVAPYLRAV
ncbi:MAG TPA: type II secretion system F family protein [Actinomycetota bacterium]|nr:type II secretion system F family protein [Actinomycetota bacterium]